MNDKSYVTLEQHACVVCGAKFDTGTLLLDNRLMPVFEQHTVTGRGLCPEHKALIDEGHIALIGIDLAKSTTRRGLVKHEDAYRTGVYAFIRPGMWEEVFNGPVPKAGISFIDQSILDHFEAQLEARSEISR